ncbi:hypothetical protein EXIGLDRAFT_729117 [Exidia glandulosa HHB12029]|uniref:Uncharacterized protein n=1 Tax=Exidia glandulosa HHB12029 TaxID=1314781 RepID=A0A165CQL4_EXIGL|nr:hypothetical protein EXIGLDRAFT_729117 [Exidia glandulosa HHB12029]
MPQNARRRRPRSGSLTCTDTGRLSERESTASSISAYAPGGTFTFVHNNGSAITMSRQRAHTWLILTGEATPR